MGSARDKLSPARTFPFSQQRGKFDRNGWRVGVSDIFGSDICGEVKLY